MNIYRKLSKGVVRGFSTLQHRNMVCSYYKGASMAQKKRFHAKMDLGSSFYDSYDTARAQERRDASMLHEDRTAIANMPQQVIYREYPKVRGYLNPNLDDTISGIDRQMEMDNKKRDENLQPEKY